MSKSKKCQWSRRTPLYVKKGDKRYAKYCKQLKDRGFADDETWSLYTVITDFVLPRLKRFREIPFGFPGNLTEKEWDDILDDMIFAFEYHKKDEIGLKKDWIRCKRGMRLFGQYFGHLWT